MLGNNIAPNLKISKIQDCDSFGKGRGRQLPNIRLICFENHEHGTNIFQETRHENLVLNMESIFTKNMKLTFGDTGSFFPKHGIGI